MKVRKFKMTAARKAGLAKGAHSPEARAKAKVTRAATLARKRAEKAGFYNKLLEHGMRQKPADNAATDAVAKPESFDQFLGEMAKERKAEQSLFIQWTPVEGGLSRSFTLAEAKELFNDLYLLFGAGR